ncbi:MAG: hypothetical protein JO058_21960 [Alphaproteobacteria bacterium]|nr:hypothetical protein [Alphaproteobacteria bacterium]MBV9153550.1 hypothetical protein [Alphaproteobacteria bacterium]
MPVNSGASPGAPLGGHRTQLPLPLGPVAVAVPADEDEPLPRAAVPAPLPEDAEPPPLAEDAEPPPPPENPPPAPEPPPLAPDTPDPVEPPVASAVFATPPPVPETVRVEVAGVEVVRVVEMFVAGEAVVPAAGAWVRVLELAMLGSATAPPEAGKPLRSEALPTSPAVGVAEGAEVCARAVAVTPRDNSKARTRARIMPLYIGDRPARRETRDQGAAPSTASR